MLPNIPEGGPRPEILCKAISKEILCTLTVPNFEIKPGTSGNILSWTC